MAIHSVIGKFRHGTSIEKLADREANLPEKPSDLC